MTGSHEVRGSIPLGSTIICDLGLRYGGLSSCYLHLRATVVCDSPALPVLLFVTQRRQWINFRRAAGGNVTSN